MHRLRPWWKRVYSRVFCVLGSEEAETACPLSANKGKKAHGDRCKMSCRNLVWVLGPPGPLGDGQLDLSFQGGTETVPRFQHSLELWVGSVLRHSPVQLLSGNSHREARGLPRPSRRDEAQSTACSPDCSSLLTKLLDCCDVLAQAA